MSVKVHLVLKVGRYATFQQIIELPISPFPGLELSLWVGNGFEIFTIDKVLIFEDVQMEEFGTKVTLIQPPTEKHDHLIEGLTKDGAWKRV